MGQTKPVRSIRLPHTKMPCVNGHWVFLFITDVTHPLNNAVYSKDVEPPQGLVVIVTLKTYAGSFKLWTKIMDKNLLELYSDYLLSSFGATTATGLSALLEGAISRSRGFSRAPIMMLKRCGNKSSQWYAPCNRTMACSSLMIRLRKSRIRMRMT